MGINRDINNVEEMIKEITTGALNGSFTIDDEWFSGEGREKILKDFKTSGSFIGNVATNLYNAISSDTTIVQALKGIRNEEVVKLATSNLLTKEGAKKFLLLYRVKKMPLFWKRILLYQCFCQK